MQWPRRGDHASLLLIGLALTTEMAFWIMAIWAPIIVVVGYAYGVRQGGVGVFDFILLPAILTVVGGMAILLRFLARALFAGSRLANAGCATLLAVFAIANLLSLPLASKYLRPQMIGICASMIGVAVMVAIAAVRRGASNG